MVRRYKKKTGRKPYAKRPSYGRKRRSNARKGRRLANPSRGFASTPFPATMYRVLTYCDDIDLYAVAVAGVPYLRDYRGNGIYDPDISGIGAQPKYFDTFCGAPGGAAPYTRFNVIASKIQLEIMPDPTLSSANDLMQIGVIPLRGAAGTNDITGIIDMTERPYCKTRIMGNTGAKAVTRMSYYVKTSQMYAGQNTNDLEFTGTYGQDPPSSNQWRWQIALINVQSAGLPKCYIRVKITYYVQFSYLNGVAGS